MFSNYLTGYVPVSSRLALYLCMCVFSVTCFLLFSQGTYQCPPDLLSICVCVFSLLHVFYFSHRVRTSVLQTCSLSVYVCFLCYMFSNYLTGYVPVSSRLALYLCMCVFSVTCFLIISQGTYQCPPDLLSICVCVFSLLHVFTFLTGYVPVSSRLAVCVCWFSPCFVARLAGNGHGGATCQVSPIVFVITCHRHCTGWNSVYTQQRVHCVEYLVILSYMQFVWFRTALVTRPLNSGKCEVDYFMRKRRTACPVNSWMLQQVWSKLVFIFVSAFLSHVWREMEMEQSCICEIWDALFAYYTLYNSSHHSAMIAWCIFEYCYLKHL